MSMKQGDILKLKIDNVAAGGEGVARHDGMAVFVEGALPGEEAECRIIFLKQNYAKAKILKLTKSSPDRVVPPCKIYDLCGACQLQHISYKKQLDIKTKIVKDNLSKIGGINPDVVLDCIGMEKPWGYRNKMQYPVRKSKIPSTKFNINSKYKTPNSKQDIAIGYYKKGTHDVVEVEDCPVLHPSLNELARAVRFAVNDAHIPPYDEDSGRGVLRHILARTAFKTGEGLLCFVINSKELNGSKYIIGNILKKLDNYHGFRLKGVSKNLNTRMTNVILGEYTNNVWGSTYIQEKLGTLLLELSVDSFFQVNPVQSEILYDTVKKYADSDKNDVIVDAYCGIGSIALWLAAAAKEVYGIEENRAAINDAQANSKLNNIRNAHFDCGKVERVLYDYFRSGLKPSIIILDPPRSGCEAKTLESAIKMRPKKIIYVSCDSATLARDLKILSQGYKIRRVQPVDMFPQTSHVESVVLLESKA